MRQTLPTFASILAVYAAKLKTIPTIRKSCEPNQESDTGLLNQTNWARKTKSQNRFITGQIASQIPTGGPHFYATFIPPPKESYRFLIRPSVIREFTQRSKSE